MNADVNYLHPVLSPPSIFSCGVPFFVISNLNETCFFIL